MQDHIMSKPLPREAYSNWDNTFGVKDKAPTEPEKPTYEELVTALDEAVQSDFANWERKPEARELVRRAKGSSRASRSG